MIGAIALNEVVSERNVAQNALELARSEAEKKVLAQQEADRKSQELLASRESAIQRAKEALQGYNAEPMLRDLYLRVESYAKTPATLRQLDLQERERNRALITAVLGYAAQLQELIRLSSAGLEVAADGRLSELQRIQAALIELAIADADFELAKYLLNGRLPEAAQAELTQRSAQTRLALLDGAPTRFSTALMMRDFWPEARRPAGNGAQAAAVHFHAGRFSGRADDSDAGRRAQTVADAAAGA